MGDFGQELRQERESRGIAIEAISDVTKISRHHLLDLEAGHFDQLPGGVLNKGIVRGYARVVGLNEEDCVHRFMDAYQNSGQLKEDDASWINFAENVGKNRPGGTDRPTMRLKWAGVVVLLVVLAALGWFVFSFVNHRMNSQAASAHSSTSSVVAPQQALSDN